MTLARGCIFSAVLFAIAMSLVISMPYRPKPHVTPQHMTRGPSEDHANVRWQQQLIDIRREEETSIGSIVWMQIQTPISVNGEVPLYQLVMFLGGGAIACLVAFLAVKSDVKALGSTLAQHQDDDAIRHQELRDDIAGLRK